ncbi:Tn3 family transposase [Streptomyces sp. 142MFCol3.1]|uniref:Tn3 family transposase n=1 Tax=Streptomyces sp. 142MFCol3.1 TaxID=1172179 RepID=UPI000409D9F5|nr:Tn3 family transposase [Streptomyces sp. 142MFCol3.1]
MAALLGRFYGRESVLTGADREHAEVSLLVLHLLQLSLILINTQLLQAVFRDPQWTSREAHRRRPARAVPAVLVPRQPVREFHIDMDSRLDITRR